MTSGPILNPGPRLLIGSGRTPDLAELLPPGPVLLVTDKSVRSLGLSDALFATLSRDRDVITFDSVEADPSRATLLAAVEAGRDGGANAVVGFGGGSPMDVAKLAAYLMGSGDDLDTIWGVGLARGRRLPLALVPTTAGTGSEATPVAIITVEGDEKRGVNSPVLIPDIAVLDAQLTVGKPRALTAATGIDAMVHAIEAYTSARLKNPLSDMQAREALRLLGANLVRACETPDDLEARQAMLLGAHLAGLAFANAPVAGVHALAYPLGGIHHLPHGLSNALMLRPVLSFNAEAAREPYAELAAILDPAAGSLGSQAAAARLIEQMEALILVAGLQPRLRDHGIAREEATMLAREAMKQQRLLINNPVPIGEDDARRLYEAAW
ncbi:iron-containing alcohol dehydrogenase [Sphingomonas astaxanthinifaciens]|uniref:Alcohol dehydrogenase n=1 Tax=Sphingomonas astaxanthinifaciens DSM 22298 TaxID=1123267 RepID=A0ABQ5Z4M8_9SPHN|nr:iron-containing alcohol dehydrogenase [Sphingomonas astaxanthinifaciens]GLR46956.1 alcohol dehydrogenase [Sphingomonas astaxanthinifaciens DSM 22298]